MDGSGLRLGSAWGRAHRNVSPIGAPYLPLVSDSCRANVTSQVWADWYFSTGLAVAVRVQPGSVADLAVIQSQSLSGAAVGTPDVRGTLGGTVAKKPASRGFPLVGFGFAYRTVLSSGLAALPSYQDGAKDRAADRAWTDWYFGEGLSAAAAVAASVVADLLVLQSQSLGGSAAILPEAKGTLGGTVASRLEPRGRIVYPGWGFAYRTALNGGHPALPFLASKHDASSAAWFDWFLYDGIRGDAVARAVAGAEFTVYEDIALDATPASVATATGALKVRRPYADTVLEDSPYGYWKLDEASGSTCADSSGNGRNLGYQGTPNYRETGPILTDSATYGVRFDGVNYENAWTSNTWTSDDFALEVWAKFTTNSSGGMGIIGRAENLEGATGEPFAIYTKDGRIKGIWMNTGFSAVIVQSSAGKNDGKWHHVILTRSGTTLRLYVDGAQVDSATASGTTLGGRGFRIGGTSLDTVCKYDGTVAHGALYLASLAADRVEAHYEAALFGFLFGDALASVAASGDLSVGGTSMSGSAVVSASSSAALALAQSLVADALARVAATASIPTPGPGFGCWTRELRPFARYGRSTAFGYRAYYDDAGALAGTAQVAATASADLSLTVIGLAGDAVIRVAVTGDLSAGGIVAEQISGSAQTRITATGDLQTNEIQGTAPVVSTATGQLRVATPLSAEAVARAIAAGTPSVLVPIGGSAAVVEAATGSILGQSGLAGSAADVANASAAMVAAMAASGSAASRAAAVASLMIGSSLAGQAAVVGTVAGAIGVGMDLDADAQARASATGTTGISTDLSGQARTSAEATGTLRDIAAVTGGIAYAVNLATGAATNLLNFDFERLVTAHGGTLYGLRSGTLYAIGGDTDPGSTAIPAAIRFAPSKYGTVGHNRLETVYLYTRELDGLTVTPIYDETDGIAYDTIPLNRDGMRASRVHVGRGNAWHTLGLIVANRDGGKLDIGGIDLVVSNLSRRQR